MVNNITVAVTNESGSHQSYAIFNKPPVVTGEVSGQIWSNVFTTASAAPGNTARFSIYKQHYAIVGTSQSNPQMGVEVDVIGYQDVTLGSTEDDGTAIEGTTVQLLVQDNTPQFSDENLPNGSDTDAFEIQTGSDFTVQEAKNGNYLVGLGGSKFGGSIDGPLASFVPEPDVQYQIQPSNTYFLTVGHYTKGSLIDETKIGGTVLTIDFNDYPSGSVSVVHNDRGGFDIEAED